MKRAIRLYTVAICIVVSAIFIAFSAFWINERFLQSTRERLGEGIDTTISLVGNAPENMDAFADHLAKSYSDTIRITVIGADGVVKGDSKGNYETMVNHLNRKEVSEALVHGHGEDVRRSDTTGQKTIYVAKRWNDDYVLRFSMPVSAAYEFAESIIPMFAVIMLLTILLVAPVSGILVRRIMRPYNELAQSIETVINDQDTNGKIMSTVEEFAPIARKFNDLNDKLADYINQVRRKTDEIQSITEKMREGLLLIDKDFNILLSNKRALDYLDIPSIKQQKNITYLYRNENFVKALHDAKENSKRYILDIKNREEQIFRVYINPVGDGNFTIFMNDVTELVHLEKIRSEFSSNVTHELKTPLTSISGFAELISSGMVTEPSAVQGYSRRIYNEAQRLMFLIDDILKLSELENEKNDQTQPVNIREVSEEAAALLATQTAEKEISVEINSNAIVTANRDYIYQMVINLMENAVKYNHQGGKIVVTLFEDDEKSGFSVADTGIGIPKEQQHRIFERFYRVDKSRNRKTGGTGLGLSIVKHIAELYHGSVSVESDQNGTVFTVVFIKEKN